MLRRVLAALAAVILAAIGVLLVVNYAQRADERALEGMQTEDVYVAVADIPEGTPSAQLTDFVEAQAIPTQFQVPGRITDLADLEGRVAQTQIGSGEQLQSRHFATPEQLRSRGDFELPEDAQDLHQLTIPLANPRALGGSIAAGDTVGVFGSFELDVEGSYAVDEDGNVIRVTEDETQADGAEGEETGDQFDLTDLLLHKVLVVRVEGGYVAPAPGLGADDDEPSDQGAADTIHVTLALEAEDAARVVFAMEFGSLWLSLEPEGASDEDTPSIVISVPDQARNVIE